jgi:hypothetical protein
MSSADLTEAPREPDGARHRRHRTAAQTDRAPAVAPSKPPVTVWAAMALHLGVMVVFTVLYPAYFGFDETGHVSRVLSAQNGDITPTPGAAPYVDGVNGSYQTYTAHDQPPFVTYPPPNRALRPTFDALGGATLHAVKGALPNQLAQHPPGYYLLAAGVLDAIPMSSHLAWDQTVGLLRLLDVLFLLPLPLICWAIVRRFAREPVAIAAAFAPLLLPALERLGGSVNNDDLLILLTSVFLLQVVKVLDGDLRPRVAVTMGTFMTLALLTKGFALVLPPIAVLTYLVAWRRSRGEFPSRQVSIVVVAGAIGGIWWLRNLLVYKTVQPPGLNDAQADEVWPSLPPGKSEHVATYAHQALDRMTTDFWGALGQTVPPSLPGAVTFIASVVAGALLVTGFFAAAATTRRVRVVDLGIVLLPTILVVVPLLFHGWADYSRTGQLIGIQGRYLYPGFVGLVAIAAVGADLLVGLLPPIASRLLPLVACVLALAIEVTAVDIVCTKLWFHNGSLLHGGASKVAHAIGATGPWPGTITLGMLALPLVTGLVALIAAVRETTRRSSESPPLGISAA